MSDNGFSNSDQGWFRLRRLDHEHCALGGDRRSLSIAAASIVAKVTRDRIMARAARRYPGFGWERNAGYGTPEHRAALDRLGVTPHHRRGVAPVARLLAERVIGPLAARGPG